MSQDTKNYTVKDQGDGKYTLKVTIPADALDKSYNAALKQESANLDIKGFRKGQVPASAVEPALKDSVIDKMMSQIVPSYLLQALMAEKINIAIPPMYKELAKPLLGTDFTFEVDVYSIPDFKLCDTTKIKVKKDDIKATEDEQKTGLQGIKDMLKENKVEIKAKSGTNAWAKEVGEFYKVDSIKTLADLKKFVKEEIEKKKEQIVQQKYQSDVLTEAIKLSKIKLHNEIIGFEAENREQSLIQKLKQANKTLEAWLEENKMSHEDLQKALKDDSRAAIEQDVFLSKYAAEKGIEVDEKQFDMFKQMIKQGQKVEETPEWLAHVQNVYIKQKAFEMLMEEAESL